VEEDAKPKRGFTLRFGNRRKDEPAAPTAPPPAAEMPAETATPPKAEPTKTVAAENTPVPPPAPAKATAAAPKEEPAMKAEPPKAIPVEDDAPMTTDTSSKGGFFSRFRAKAKPEE